MKFLTLVSIQFVLSVIPNFKLKLIVMLCPARTWSGLSKNAVHCYIPETIIYSFYFPISIEQNSHKAVSLILHL